MKSLVRSIFRVVGEKTDTSFRVVFTDGSNYRSRQSPPEFTIRFLTPWAQWRGALFGHVGMLESYFDGSIEVDGDFRRALAVGMETGLDRRSNRFLRVRNRWHEFRHSNSSLRKAKDNARFHYGLGGEFYRYWLDVPLMMYTCAYWTDQTQTVEEAQRSKIDYVCRKIRLQPGESVVDIDCGFGGFMFHAAKRYGARVTGVNATTEQVQWVHDQIQREGMQDRLEIREQDFREVHAQFDKVVSIGTLEHAGRGQLGDMLRAHAAYLKPGGLGLIHFIGHVGHTDTDLFIRKYVFPGGWIPSLADVIVEMEKCGLEVLDIENMRRHYARTLDAWLERFESNWEQIRSLDPQRFDERFRRIWRTYLLGCAEMFRIPNGHTHLFQIAFSKGNVSESNYPMSRDFLYGEEPAGTAAEKPTEISRPAKAGARHAA